MRLKPLRPVTAVQCPTCPFRDDGWTHLRDFLIQRALNEGTPICHSTGPRAVKRTGRRWTKARLCRGARNFQLTVFYAWGILDAPTDEAWQRAWEAQTTPSQGD